MFFLFAKNKCVDQKKKIQEEKREKKIEREKREKNVVPVFVY